MNPDEEIIARQTVRRGIEERNRRPRRRSRRRLNNEEERPDHEEEEERPDRNREYPTFSAMIGPPSTLNSLKPLKVKYHDKGEEEIKDAPRKRKREELPILQETETLPSANKKRIGENKSTLPLPQPRNPDLKWRLQAAQKIKKKYINMAKKSSKVEKEKSQPPDNPPDNPPDKPSLKRKMKVVKKIKKKHIKMANQSIRKKLLSPPPLKSPNAPKVKKKDKMTLKRKMQAAKKIKKKYIKMAYPKLSFRKKDKKK